MSPQRWLVLDAASGASGAGGARAIAALLDAEGGLLAEVGRTGPGGAAGLPALLAALFDEAGAGALPQAARSLAGIACVIGPGSFTGLRATLALAHGLHAGGAPEPVAVSVGEACGVDLDPDLWAVTMARRGRAFVETGGCAPFGVDLADPDAALTERRRPARLAGDGAALLAPLIGVPAVFSVPAPADILAAARRRLAGLLPPRAVLPLYVDPPQVTMQAQGAPASR